MRSDVERGPRERGGARHTRPPWRPAVRRPAAGRPAAATRRSATPRMTHPSQPALCPRRRSHDAPHSGVVGDDIGDLGDGPASRHTVILSATSARIVCQLVSLSERRTPCFDQKRTGAPPPLVVGRETTSQGGKHGYVRFQLQRRQQGTRKISSAARAPTSPRWSTWGFPSRPASPSPTEACKAYLASGHVPANLRVEVTMALRQTEDAIGRHFGADEGAPAPSVRSGAKFSMPGMMETVLNVGLNDRSVEGLARFAGDRRFAWDSYRPPDPDVRQDRPRHRRRGLRPGARRPEGEGRRQERPPLTAADHREVVAAYKADRSGPGGADFPQDPRTQLDMANPGRVQQLEHRACPSLSSPRAHPHDLGTAVNVIAMVFGNLGDTSGTGVCFTRDPSSGLAVCMATICPTPGRGRRRQDPNTLPLSALEDLDGKSYRELRAAMRRLGRTTATCVTSSSPSGAASCGCCRPASASAPRPRPSGWRRSSWTNT